MFTVAWWYMLATYIALWIAVMGDANFLGVALGLLFVQVVHFGSQDDNYFSFACQVRYVIAALLLAGLWEPLSMIYWFIILGLTVRLTTNYCFLARLVSLLPWNLKQPFSWELAKKRIFSKPVKGSILQASV